MLEKRFNRRNLYIDTYHVYDTERKEFVGVIEDHCRDVSKRYFIGWKFEDNRFIPGSFQSGKTKMCDTYEEALEYIQEPYEKEIDNRDNLDER